MALSLLRARRTLVAGRARGIRPCLLQERRDGELPTYVARELPITLLNGDYFAVEGLACDALYDRAALVALPPDLRRRYAAHTDGLLREGAFRLLITLEYEQALVQGPPFAVLADEVRGYWPELEQLSRVHDGEAAPPKFRAAGAALTEVTWRSPTAAVSR